MRTIPNLIASEAEIIKVVGTRYSPASNNPQLAPRKTPPKREGDILSLPFFSFLREATRSMDLGAFWGHHRLSY
jgi:hypothetical protein